VEGPALSDVVGVAPRPATNEPCVVAGDGDPGTSKPFDVFASHDATSPIAVVQVPNEVALRFTSWPSRDDDQRTGVEIEAAESLRMNGFVDLSKRTFQLGARVDVVAPHVFAKVGTVVRVRGAREGGLLVDVPTPFETPRSFGVVLPCHAVAYRNASLASSAGDRGALPVLLPRTNALSFYASPSGAAIFHAGVVRDRTPLTLLERRGDSAHVLVGHAPENVFPGATLIVDAWVRTDAVTHAPPNEDRDSHGSILDGFDRCPAGPRLLSDAPLRLGAPNGPVIGTARAGAPVEPGAPSGDHVAIAFTNPLVIAPPGKSFFVPASAVTDCRPGARSPEDGCPCSGP
jgi:hypothetical protein